MAKKGSSKLEDKLKVAPEKKKKKGRAPAKNAKELLVRNADGLVTRFEFLTDSLQLSKETAAAAAAKAVHDALLVYSDVLCRLEETFVPTEPPSKPKGKIGLRSGDFVALKGKYADIYKGLFKVPEGATVSPDVIGDFEVLSIAGKFIQVKSESGVVLGPTARLHFGPKLPDGIGDEVPATAPATDDL